MSLENRIPSHPVLPTTAHVVREANASVPPPSELLEQGFVNISLLQQQLYGMVAKARREFLQINLGSDINPAVGRNQSIRDNRMQRGMEVHQIAKGLNRHNHPGNNFFFSMWLERSLSDIQARIG